MTTTSRFGAVVDALITLIDATDVVMVFDAVALTADVPADYCIVWGTDDLDDDAGSFEQTWNGLGARTKEETGEVVCAVLAGTGDDDMNVVRDRALSIVGQIETALRADPSLGGAVASGWAHFAAGRPKPYRNSRGLYVRVIFTVAYQTHI